MTESDSDIYQEPATELLIVGGGLVGMTLGIACAANGIRTVVVEAERPVAQTDISFDGRSSAIAYGSQQVLNAIGVWEHLAGAAEPIRDIRVTDGGWHVKGESAGYVHYSHLDLEPGTLPGQERADRPEHAPFGYIVENRATRIGLFERMKTCPNLTHVAPAFATSLSLSKDRAVVALNDGREISAALVVAADGRQSNLRRLAGISHQTFDYHQSAIVCTVTHEKPHHGVAHEHFLPAGPFAMLPMTDEIQADGTIRHRSSIVWSEDPRIVPMLLKLEDAEFGMEIERRFGLSLGQVRPVGPRFSYPLQMVLADGYVRDRFAIIGDAAHGIHPIAGQGFNLGIRDAAALAEVLVDAKRSGQDLGSPEVLERYARWRRFDNLMLAGVMDGLTRLFSNDVGPFRLMRDIGFFLFNRAKPMKRLAMRHAMGVVGKLPKLVQGQPL